jgi:hypothetical protein
MATTIVPITLNLLPQPLDICITRKDAFTFGFELTKDGSPIDLTDDTFLLTVNEAADASGAELFQLSESNTPDATGIVTFLPSVVDLTQAPATYFFDVQRTASPSGEIRTIIKGEFVISADITDP